MTAEKTPLDQALDLLVFAPLGLALTARDQLDEVIAKGRGQVEGQVTMARMIGQFAVTQGKAELEKRLKAYVDGPKPAPAAPPPPTGAPVPAAAAPPAPAAAPAAVPAPSSGPSADDLAIPGYDALSASQVVQRLGGLSRDELAQVEAYEQAGRGRKTILSKIAQLSA